MRIGLFGGSFDPPHIGHAIVAQYALERLELGRVLFVPAARPPHKRERRLAPAEVRAEMVGAMIAGDPACSVDDMEFRREGPSYTVDTLRGLVRLHPSDDLVLLLGADQFGEFHTWREPAAIERLAEIAVLDRGGGPAAGPAVNVRHTRVGVPRIEVSSSEIRARVAAEKSIRYLVPAPVLEIIEREGLYRASAHAGREMRGNRGPC